MGKKNKRKNNVAKPSNTQAAAKSKVINYSPEESSSSVPVPVLNLSSNNSRINYDYSLSINLHQQLQQAGALPLTNLDESINRIRLNGVDYRFHDQEIEEFMPRNTKVQTQAIDTRMSGKPIAQQTLYNQHLLQQLLYQTGQTHAGPTTTSMMNPTLQTAAVFTQAHPVPQQQQQQRSNHHQSNMNGKLVVDQPSQQAVNQQQPMMIRRYERKLISKSWDGIIDLNRNSLDIFDNIDVEEGQYNEFFNLPIPAFQDQQHINCCGSSMHQHQNVNLQQQLQLQAQLTQLTQQQQQELVYQQQQHQQQQQQNGLNREKKTLQRLYPNLFAHQTPNYVDIVRAAAAAQRHAQVGGEYDDEYDEEEEVEEQQLTAENQLKLEQAQKNVRGMFDQRTILSLSKKIFERQNQGFRMISQEREDEEEVDEVEDEDDEEDEGEEDDDDEEEDEEDGDDEEEDEEGDDDDYDDDGGILYTEQMQQAYRHHKFYLGGVGGTAAAAATTAAQAQYNYPEDIDQQQQQTYDKAILLQAHKLQQQAIHNNNHQSPNKKSNQNSNQQQQQQLQSQKQTSTTKQQQQQQQQQHQQHQQQQQYKNQQEAQMNFINGLTPAQQQQLQQQFLYQQQQKQQNQLQKRALQNQQQQQRLQQQHEEERDKKQQKLALQQLQQQQQQYLEQQQQQQQLLQKQQRAQNGGSQQQQPQVQQKQISSASKPTDQSSASVNKTSQNRGWKQSPSTDDNSECTNSFCNHLKDEYLDLEQILRKIYFERFRYDEIKEFIYPALRKVENINNFFDILFNSIREYAEEAKTHLHQQLKTIVYNCNPELLETSKVHQSQQSQPAKIPEIQDFEVIFSNNFKQCANSFFSITSQIYDKYYAVEDFSRQTEKIVHIYIDNFIEKNRSIRFNCAELHKRIFVFFVFNDPMISNYLEAKFNFFKTRSVNGSQYNECLTKLSEIHNILVRKQQFIPSEDHPINIEIYEKNSEEDGGFDDGQYVNQQNMQQGQMMQNIPVLQQQQQTINQKLLKKRSSKKNKNMYKKAGQGCQFAQPQSSSIASVLNCDIQSQTELQDPFFDQIPPAMAYNNNTTETQKKKKKKKKSKAAAAAAAAALAQKSQEERIDFIEEGNNNNNNLPNQQSSSASAEKPKKGEGKKKGSSCPMNDEMEQFVRRLEESNKNLKEHQKIQPIINENWIQKVKERYAKMKIKLNK